MASESRKCLNCGAKNTSESTKCSYCNEFFNPLDRISILTRGGEKHNSQSSKKIVILLVFVFCMVILVYLFIRTSSIPSDTPRENEKDSFNGILSYTQDSVLKMAELSKDNEDSNQEISLDQVELDSHDSFGEGTSISTKTQIPPEQIVSPLCTSQKVDEYNSNINISLQYISQVEVYKNEALLSCEIGCDQMYSPSWCDIWLSDDPNLNFPTKYLECINGKQVEQHACYDQCVVLKEDPSSYYNNQISDYQNIIQINQNSLEFCGL